MKIFSFVVALVFILLKTSGQNYNLERIDIPAKKVNCIYQDQEGVLWIGSYNGLIKYLGESYVIYVSQQDEPYSLSNNIVTSISEDAFGNLWVGTVNGLNMFNRKTETFKSFFKNEKDGGLCHNNIQELYKDRHGNLWIAGETGLCKLKRAKNGDFRFSVFHLNDIANIPGEISFECFLEANDGNLYMGASNSLLFIYKKDSANLHKFDFHTPDNPNSTAIQTIEELEDNVLVLGAPLNDYYFFDILNKRFINKPRVSALLKKFNPLGMEIYSMKKDNTGKLWLGLANSLSIFDLEKEKLLYSTDIFRNENTAWELYKDQAYTIYEDKDGIMWVSFMNLGLEKNVPGKFLFHKYKTEIKNSKTKRDYIKEIIEKNNLLFIATFGDGLIIADKKGNVKKRVDLSAHTNSSISNMIFEICFDVNGILWIASSNGFHSYNTITEKVEHSFFVSADSKDYSPKNKFTGLVNQNDSVMWLISEEKVRKFNPMQPSFLEDKETNVVNTCKPIRLLYIDRDENYWILCPDKFLHYIPDKDSTITYASKTFRQISTTSTNYMLHSEAGKYWFSTSNGLYCFDKEKHTFTHYKGHDKFFSNYISDIEEDEQLNIWVINNQGLTRFNPSTREFIKFGQQNGLSERADHIDPGKGNFFYITDERAFYRFHPDSLSFDSLHAPIYFTGLSISGQQVAPWEKTLSGVAIQYRKHIELPYSKNSVSLRFNLLDYASPEGHTYSYRLLGSDSAWIDIGNNNTINFTGLSAGKYMLEVKGKAQNKIGESRSLKLGITIHPPFWTSTWGFVLYGTMGLLALMLYRFYTLKRMRRENLFLKEKMEMEKAREFDHMKMKFFFNISHEIRTPLTLVSAPLSRLIKKEFNHEDSRTLALIYRNVSRLKEMVNQMLDAGKFDAGKYTPEIVKGNLEYLLKDIINSFKASTDTKSILFNHSVKGVDENCWYSPDALEKIVTNLLVNALKFTDEGGLINFGCLVIMPSEAKTNIARFNKQMTPVVENELQDSRYLMAWVEDTGKGIEPSDLLPVFERYHQITEKQYKNQRGWGIGLSLTKDLIARLNGSLFIQSYPGEGTTVMMLLPLDKQAYPKAYFSVPDMAKYKHNLINKHELLPDPEPHEKAKANLQQKSTTKPRVLLVEDNEDLLHFLKDVLNDQYTVTLARDGKEALKLLDSDNIDLIVSDIMMPGMDGLELCKSLKNDIRTSHIPIILLTAKTSGEDEVKGLEIGADDYISKPFNPGALLLRISNIMETREKVWGKIDHGLELIPVEDKLTDYDSYLLNKIIETIRENITNPDFSQNDICKTVGISRSQLYRKTRSLANQSVNDLIKGIRLREAAKILQEGNNVNITELSYALGFNKPGYFIELFKKKFGTTPKAYHKKHGNIP